jgi:hypothetical protein
MPHFEDSGQTDVASSTRTIEIETGREGDIDITAIGTEHILTQLAPNPGTLFGEDGMAKVTIRALLFRSGSD